MTLQMSNWQHLAEQASKELDPARLITLVEELNRTSAENDRIIKRKQAKRRLSCGTPANENCQANFRQHSRACKVILLPAFSGT
jgi:hypothetical protein